MSALIGGPLPGGALAAAPLLRAWRVRRASACSSWASLGSRVGGLRIGRSDVLLDLGILAADLEMGKRTPGADVRGCTPRPRRESVHFRDALARWSVGRAVRRGAAHRPGRTEMIDGVQVVPLKRIPD